jgi:hypothetical protein
MTVRSALTVGALAALAAGCTNSFVVVPATGARATAASADGYALVASPESWDGNPSNLREYLTPVWVEVTNQSPRNVRVRYMDFALRDSTGFRYAAISPYTGKPQVYTRRLVKPGARTAPPATAPTAPPPQSPNAAPTESPPAAAPPAATPLSYQGGSPLGTPEYRAKVLSMRYGRNDGSPGRGDSLGRYYGNERSRYAEYHDYHQHPGYHSDPHTPFLFAPGPGFWQPWPQFAPMYGEGTWVYSWEYGHEGQPSGDILQLGLPEGELQPGGRVAGFIYFQHATRQPGRLDLTWSVHGMDGRPLMAVDAPMLVVKD